LVLPYFTPTGTPYFDVHAKGAILGLDLTVTRGEILKALLEGVAFEIRLNLDILRKSGYEVKELRVIGGGARSLRHIQLKADVTGMPVIAMDVTEAGCLGVAILARAALTGLDVREIADEWVRPAARVEPRHADHYSTKFEMYRKLYSAIKAFG
jgi:xylulokinase